MPCEKKPRYFHVRTVRHINVRMKSAFQPVMLPFIQQVWFEK